MKIERRDTMKLLKINIPKSKLDTIPEIEKVFFIQLMQFLNELNILNEFLSFLKIGNYPLTVCNYSDILSLL